jgi:hypothetical protein
LEIAMPVDVLERHGRDSLLDIIAAQRLEIARHERDFNEQAKTLRIVQARCTELLLENREQRARIVAWLRETGRYDNPWNLSDVADAIERGDHVKSP